MARIPLLGLLALAPMAWGQPSLPRPDARWEGVDAGFARAFVPEAVAGLLSLSHRALILREADRPSTSSPIVALRRRLETWPSPSQRVELLEADPEEALAVVRTPWWGVDARAHLLLRRHEGNDRLYWLLGPALDIAALGPKLGILRRVAASDHLAAPAAASAPRSSSRAIDQATRSASVRGGHYRDHARGLAWSPPPGFEGRVLIGAPARALAPDAEAVFVTAGGGVVHRLHAEPRRGRLLLGTLTREPLGDARPRRERRLVRPGFAPAAQVVLGPASDRPAAVLHFFLNQGHLWRLESPGDAVASSSLLVDGFRFDAAAGTEREGTGRLDRRLGYRMRSPFEFLWLRPQPLPEAFTAGASAVGGAANGQRVALYAVANLPTAAARSAARRILVAALGGKGSPSQHTELVVQGRSAQVLRWREGEAPRRVLTLETEGRVFALVCEGDDAFFRRALEALEILDR